MWRTLAMVARMHLWLAGERGSHRRETLFRPRLERLNATFRERLAPLARRCRAHQTLGRAR